MIAATKEKKDPSPITVRMKQDLYEELEAYMEDKGIEQKNSAIKYILKREFKRWRKDQAIEQSPQANLYHTASEIVRDTLLKVAEKPPTDYGSKE